MLGLLILLLLTSGKARSEDWPQFLGPLRNGVYPSEVALFGPRSGPALLWKIDIGQGFSAPVVARGRVILFHRLENRAVVEALDAGTGRPVWLAEYPTD